MNKTDEIDRIQNALKIVIDKDFDVIFLLNPL